MAVVIVSTKLIRKFRYVCISVDCILELLQKINRNLSKPIFRDS